MEDSFTEANHSIKKAPAKERKITGCPKPNAYVVVCPEGAVPDPDRVGPSGREDRVREGMEEGR